MGLKEVVLGIAIMILTIFVVVYGINVFMPSAEYSDFCDTSSVNFPVETEAACTDVGGKWNPSDSPKPTLEGGVDGWCDTDYYCREDWDQARENYSRNIFLITLPLGILLLALGAFVFGLESVGSGLMGGGVGVIIYGVGGFWQFADDWLKFILSLIGLIIVIWLAHYWNRKYSKPKRRK